MADPRDLYSTLSFSQSNPEKENPSDVPALLRRVADSIEALGDVTVQDIVMHTDLTDLTEDGEVLVWPSLTVYYSREDES